MVQEPRKGKGTAWDLAPTLCSSPEPIYRVIDGGGEQLIDPIGSQRHPRVWGQGGVSLVLPGEHTTGQR